MLFAMGQIRAVTALTEVYEDLDRFFDLKENAGHTVRLVALLFARPESELTGKEIIPHLPYFDHRSGKHFNFYCGGYKRLNGKDKSAVQTHKKVGFRSVTGDLWYWDQDFESFCRQVEELSTWKYSGGVDLILTNARQEKRSPLGRLVESNKPRAWLDFSSAISVNLDEMRKDNVIPSVEIYFESICRYAESQNGIDPAWGFSEEEGKKLAGSALKKLLLSFIPESLRGNAEKAFQSVVKNMRRK